MASQSSRSSIRRSKLTPPSDLAPLATEEQDHVSSLLAPPRPSCQFPNNVKIIPLFFALLTLTALGEGPNYTFTLNGERLENPVLPVISDRKGKVTAGDLFRHYSLNFVVGKPGHYQLRTDRSEGFKLFCRVDDGPEHCIGLSVKMKSVEDNEILLDPLSEMPAEEKKHLRLVTLEARPADWKGALEHIDWSHCLLTISEKAADPKKPDRLPNLPKQLRYLDLEPSRSQGFKDFSSLAELKLLFLDLHYSLRMDARSLGGQSELVHLIGDSITFTGIGGLETLSAMKFLKLRRGDGIPTVGFANHMPELRVLKIDQTAVSDISQLACPQLRLLSAMETSIDDLPAPEQVPLLKDLRILSTPAGLDPETVASFQVAHPDCEIAAEWTKALHRKVGDVDRIRVRSGGTCHRDKASEKTLVEVDDRESIDDLLKGLEINDEQSGFHCMCCGEPTIELYRDHELVASLGFHHGHSLRWPGGLWPGDAAMTEASSRHLCEFLAKHGHDGPLREFEESQARERAADRYAAALSEIAPDRFYDELEKIIWDEEAQSWNDLEDAEVVKSLSKLVHAQWPDPVTRCRKLFAIYGALPNGSWNLSLGLDEALRDVLLPAVSGQSGEVLDDRSFNEQTLQGIARWCLFDREGEATRKAIGDAHYSTLIQWGLSHPREDNRFMTVVILGRDGQTELLDNFFAKPPAVRELPEEHRIEPGGMTTYLPIGSDIPVGASPKAAAAILLAKHGSEGIRNQLEKLKDQSENPDAEAYQKAIDLLKEAAD